MTPNGTQSKPQTEVRLIYRSAVMQTLMNMVERVARSSAAVLITGESGVGKELVARAVHRSSFRRDHPLVDINCAALPENLIESELFGYEKGAFSGAESTRPGLFESADGGSLFLDEVGDLDLRLQVKLLRVLDGAPFYRLGGREKISVDVRIIAATNQPLEQSVQTGRFRLDLFHRLSQFQLRVPPLRVRPDDIEELATYFAQQQQAGATISESAMNALRGYRWPGNVRELRNVITQAVLMATDNRVTTVQLPIEVASGAHVANKDEAGPPDLDSVEQKTILEALARNQSNQTKTAKEL
ncbi:MAG TPA: sigma-54 dependent transcriptional regulator, partial [Pyrinomonadaceae bacterium]|nr:sigma-54 dependent transcriptional regulator [Pyrinomonadaceae bacterium]